MRSAVVTVVAGRHDHLLRQRRSLAAGSLLPGLHVVVAMGDCHVRPMVDDGSGLPTLVIEVDSLDGRLPLAAARNAGFAAAIAAGAEVIIGLDVDCLAGHAMVARYAEAASTGGTALLCGAVTYLPEGTDADHVIGNLEVMRNPHSARPDPVAGTSAVGDHLLFWSLSFALRADTWSRIGGFDERFAGYGAEDTDFGQRARAAGVPLFWLGGADAFHQYHPTASPPVQHTGDLLRNGRIFAGQWGWWPMQGWFEQLAANGMVTRDGSGWARPETVRLLTIPAEHPYIAAVRPQHVASVDPDRAPNWAPDPALTAEGLAGRAGRIDVAHVHFGFDHLSEPDMERWLAAIRDLGVPLVVTVHDLRNPHHPSPGLHEAHLALLLRAAAEVITLTPGAAAAIESTYGLRATVIAHPTLLERAAPPHDTEPGLVAIHLKSLRTNVLEPERIVRATVAGARRAGGRVRLDLHPDAADHPDLAFVAGLAGESDVEVTVHGRFDDRELAAYLAQAHASVLPYRFGTHSGWLELCRDVGTRVVAPDCGFYAEQWDDAVSYRSNERAGLDEQGLSDAVAAALGRPPPAPANWEQRRLDREIIRMRHAGVYAAALRR